MNECAVGGVLVVELGMKSPTARSGRALGREDFELLEGVRDFRIRIGGHLVGGPEDLTTDYTDLTDLRIKI